MQQQPNGYSPWHAWLHEVQARLSRQEEQIRSLEMKLSAVCDQLQQLETKPTYNIENLQYHFDQLKVEKLEGTLNIGMTPPGSESPPGDIEQLSAKKQNVFPSAAAGISPPSAGGPYSDVQAQMNQYLDTMAPQKLMQMESDIGLTLDPYHRRLIINDIRKQLPTRIHYYMQTAAKDQAGTPLDADGEAAFKADIFAKTSRDADAALQQYLCQLQGSDNSNLMNNS
ncbi:spore germination protein GerPC [Paenibacillus radicis (ex Gao et al. 2016)]|uniref:Germination protein PC n=1 Tax=Paenibacillus radicis (ex Gao et al. 2016) TaxID=1737354 RepID=A0A917LTJ2_9BACL|nr:spore germination protein GerPC [Paenibacillus radicis (ex Gao et al. 2016)]GGG56569.1 germination protein PC [Paenibacillus radicis (ex Gao et al. 2016)]